MECVAQENVFHISTCLVAEPGSGSMTTLWIRQPSNCWLLRDLRRPSWQRKQQTHDNAGGSSGSAQVHKHYALGEEDWKDWQYQFGVAPHVNSARNGALLDIVNRM